MYSNTNASDTYSHAAQLSVFFLLRPKVCFRQKKDRKKEEQEEEEKGKKVILKNPLTMRLTERKTEKRPETTYLGSSDERKAKKSDALE